MVALRTALDIVDNLRYKLLMVGVGVLGPYILFEGHYSLVKGET